MDYVHQILDKRPLVHCITNIVTVNDCANALLAVGASPTMAHHPEEMEEIQKGCDALVCNLGATENYDAMGLAAKWAEKSKHPVVIDPVGCGGSAFRRQFFRTLLTLCKPACIRGNYAEITALAEDMSTVTGVDAGSFRQKSCEDIETCVKKLARDTGAIVVASGVVDVIGCANGQASEQIVKLYGGDRMMSRITGVGCMESSLLGAFLAVETSVEAVRACCEMMKQAGKEAATETRLEGKGSMTFREKLMDNLYVDLEG